MRLILLLLIIFCNCTHGSLNNKEPYVFTEYSHNFSSFKELYKTIPIYLKKHVLQKNNLHDNSVLISGFLNDSTIFIYSSKDKSIVNIDIPRTIDAKNTLYNFKDDEIYLLDTLNQIVLLNRKLNTQEIFSSDFIKKSEFVKYPMYNYGLTFYGDSIILDYGNITKDNFKSNDVFKVLFKDMPVKKLGRYIPEFKSKYQHYDKAIAKSHDSLLYYTFQVSKRMFKYNIESDSYNSVLLKDSEGYLDYDTTKFNNMVYLVDYTKRTKFNVHLSILKNHVLLISNQGNKDFQTFNLEVYDKNLNFLSSSKLNFNPLRGLISDDGNSVYISDVFLNKIYKYELK